MSQATLQLTPDGWNFGSDDTPARGGVRSMTSADRPPPHRMTASAAALLARPLPVLDLPPVGEGTEADLIRLCDVARTISLHCADLESLIGRTVNEPPHGISGRLAELDRRLSLVSGAISSIRAKTPAGLRAKGILIAASGSVGKGSLDDQPMMRSLLADCAYLPA